MPSLEEWVDIFERILLGPTWRITEIDEERIFRRNLKIIGASCENEIGKTQSSSLYITVDRQET